MTLKSWLRAWSSRNLLSSAKRRPPDRKGRFRKLEVEPLESRILPSTIQWGNAAGGDWGTAGNWVGGVVPGAGDDAVISIASAVTISITSGEDESVSSLTTAGADTLSISGGSLTVTGQSGTLASTLSGPLTMTGGTLIANGTGVTFTANGTTTISAASLSAQDGAKLSLPGLKSYQSDGTYFQATGVGGNDVGSVLDVSALTTLTQQGYWEIYAQNGGEVKLNGMTSLTGVQSIDIYDAGGSTLLDPNLTTLAGVSVSTDGSDTHLADSWTKFTGSAASGAFQPGTLTVTGGSYSLPRLTDVDDSSLDVQFGGALALPGLKSYQSDATYFRATGVGGDAVGSVLDVSALTTLTQQDYWKIYAQSGGEVKLNGMTSLTGVQSIDIYDAGGSTLLDPNLTTLAGVSVSTDGSDTHLADSWTKFTGSAASGAFQPGTLTVTGGSYSLPGLTDVDDSSLDVQSGGALALPQLKSYQSDATYFRATGVGGTDVGSVLDVSALTTLTQQAYWEIYAEHGGQVKLNGMTALTSVQSIDVYDDTGGALLDPNLTTLAGVNVTTDGSDTQLGNAWTTFTGSTANTGNLAVTGGTLTLPSLTEFATSSFQLSGGAVLSLPVLTTGSITIDNGVSVTIQGVVVSMPANGINSGAISIPSSLGLTVATSGAFTNSGSLTLGAGSTLKVPGNFTQTSAGELSVSVGGAPATGLFGKVADSGTAALAGALDVSLANGFTPSGGQKFDVVTFASATGAFMSFPGLNPDFTQALTGTAEELTASLALPAITSAASDTFTAGTAGSFTVTDTGTPTPTLSESGAPAGVSFAAGTGVLSSTTTAAAGIYTLTFTATNTLNSVTQTFTLTLAQAPQITSATSATFTTGTAGSFTLTDTGTPTPTLSETGARPSGLSFNATNGVLSSTATAALGFYTLTFVAVNGFGSPASQTFTLTVGQAPQITSAGSATFTAGAAGSFTVTDTGTPTPALTESGAPTGVSISSGVLSSTAAAAPGVYTLTFTAANGVLPNATQTFTLTLAQAPAITSANHATFTTGAASSFTLTDTGVPTPTLSETGSPPAGVSFSGGVLSSTAAAAAGVYTLTFTAVNGFGNPAAQTFTLTVGQAPQITSAAGVTFTAGAAGSFTLTDTGTPTPTLTESGAPTGVSISGGVLSSTAAAAPGVYTLTFTAANGVLPNASQTFTLTLAQAPQITSASSITFATGTANAFTVTDTGAPAPTLSETGSPPAGVSFSGGVLSSTGTAALGVYTLTFVAANGFGSPYTQTFTLTVAQVQPPAITSGTSATFTKGTAGSFTVTDTGTPAPTLTESGAPAGVSLNGGVLSSTTAAAAGVYTLTFTAANGVGNPFTQTFTLTVGQAPAITSAASATFTAGEAGSFTVTGAGTPAPALSETATLPAGVSFSGGVLSSTAAGAPGVYDLTFVAANGVGAPFSQPFTLTVTNSPFSVNGTTLTVTGTAGNDTFTFAAGSPEVVTLNGTSFTVPAAVTVIQFQGDGGADTATLTAGTAGVQATLQPGGGKVTGTGYEVDLTKTAIIVVYGGGGDTANLSDAGAAGANTFTDNTTTAYFNSPNNSFFNEAVGFHTVVASAAAGGTDLAVLFGAASGTGSFTGLDGTSYLSTLATFAEAVGFPVVVANSIGGHDTATLFDAGGGTTNQFVGTSTQGYLYDSTPGRLRPNYFNEANAFQVVVARATKGASDTATLFDGSGTNAFYAYPTFAYLTNLTSSYFNEVIGFPAVAVNAVVPQAVDVAYFAGSGGAADVFTGTPTSDSLQGSNYLYTVLGFRAVAATEAGGGAAASLIDNRGGATYSGSGVYGLLAGQGYSIALSGFSSVAATALDNVADHLNLLALDYAFSATPPADWQ